MKKNDFLHFPGDAFHIMSTFITYLDAMKVQIEY